MNKTELLNKATRTFGKIKLSCIEHGPEILSITGIIGLIGSGVMIGVATYKTVKVVEDVNEKKETLEPEETKKLYTKSALQIAGLYAPPVILGTLSLGCVLTSNRILKKRNIALAAAYTAIDTTFKDYRRRVVERYGETTDKELRYGITHKEVKETITDENGNEVEVTKVVDFVDKTPSEYARYFDESCIGYTSNPESNMWYIKQREIWANEKLREQGFLFLNDVYEMFGFDKTEAGQIVGWRANPEDPNYDGYVSFGIYNVDNEANRAFVNGQTSIVCLDFNVDGPILSVLKKKGE